MGLHIQSQCQIKYSQTSRFPPKVEIILNHVIKIQRRGRGWDKSSLIAVQIHLFLYCLSLPLLSFGLSPSGPNSPCCFSTQRRAGSWHIGGHAEKKHFQLGIFSETEPKGVSIYTHTHTLWMLNFVYQKSEIQGYSINIIPLLCGHFLDLKSMSLTVRSCPFLSLNRDLSLNMYRQQKKTAIWRIQLIACSKGKWQLWTFELLDLLIPTLQAGFTHISYHVLWLKCKAIENWHKPI